MSLDKEVVSKLLVSVIFWSLLIGFSLFWNIHNEKKQVLELASIAARENFNKDQAFRRWGSLHGGVYVPPNERTPPNPYLAHLPKRDITTEGGTKLTLMNPAYMLRQMMTEYDELYGVKAKITGLVLLNPINKPDEWEINALHAFEEGVEEVSAQADIDGKLYLRLMRPMYMKKSCEKCHAHLGFKDGDLRGGVGVAVPLDTYIKNGEEKLIVVWSSHAVIWLLGVMGLWVLFYYGRQNAVEKEKNLILEQDMRLAEEASQAKSQFLSHMSHELRTPMNAILGFAQMLEMDSADFNETQRGNVGEILGAGSHLLHLINDVLDLAKIESGKLEMSMEDVCVNNLLQQCALMIQPQMDLRQIECINQVGENNYVVRADKVRLKQVVLNLFSNAVKYNREQGRVILSVEIVDEKNLRILVKDTGEGLSEKEISKLFSAFERLNNKNNVEGAGIGLVITKYLIEMMGGTVGVESVVGKGSTFWVELPLVASGDLSS